MRVTSSSIINGFFEDKYGKRGTQKYKGYPSLSIPFTITNEPKNTVSFAVVLDDKDAVEVCGFTWIHWLIANLKSNFLEENESITNKELLQGVTSEHSAISSLSVEDATGYAGMAPPDKPHRYDLTVYALDCELELKEGFTYNQLWYAMQGHILDCATLTAIYKN